VWEPPPGKKRVHTVPVSPRNVLLNQDPSIVHWSPIVRMEKVVPRQVVMLARCGASSVDAEPLA
jgi:hypothetical protein